MAAGPAAAIGLRPISALVDITNFFTFDRNRPLHVFDADKVQGRSARAPRQGRRDRSLALDDRTYTFEPGMMVISTTMAPKHRRHHGRASTGCTDETHRMCSRSAYWDPIPSPPPAAR
jgi:phenylalanyl-tRNA synthetase beta chain